MKKLFPISILLFLCFLCFQCEQEIIKHSGVFPIDGQKISAKQANNLTLSWVPAKFWTGDKTIYHLDLFEVDSVLSEGDVARYIFKKIFETTTDKSFLKLPSTLPSLKRGKIYAWKVSAGPLDGLPTKIKELTYFLVDDLQKRKQQPAELTSLCSTCFIDDIDCTTLVCIQSPCPTVIHRSTGLFSILPPTTPSTKSATLGVLSEDSLCLDLGPDNRINIICGYDIIVPVDKIDSMGPDLITVKAFRFNQSIPEADLEIDSYRSLFNENPTELRVTREDYGIVCIDSVHYGRAVLNFNLSFPVTTIQNLSGVSFIAEHKVAIELLPDPIQGENAAHVHDNGIIHEDYSPSPPFPSPCQHVTYGTYQYYQCFDTFENNDNLHQGQHIVRFKIDPRIFCGDWNKNLPYLAPHNPYAPVNFLSSFSR